METTWNNYRSQRSGKIAGAYLYLKGKFAGNLYKIEGGWAFHSPQNHAGMYLGRTMAEAKTAVAEWLTTPQLLLPF